MQIEIVTKQDLEMFRKNLLEDIAGIIAKKPQQNRKFLRSKEVREILKISAGSLTNMRIKGLLHPTKVGSIYYWPVDEIEKLLDGKERA